MHLPNRVGANFYHANTLDCESVGPTLWDFQSVGGGKKFFFKIENFFKKSIDKIAKVC